VHIGQFLINFKILLFIHHLELFSIGDIDDEVEKWLRASWQKAG
jgi:hypothetical protein